MRQAEQEGWETKDDGGPWLRVKASWQDCWLKVAALTHWLHENAAVACASAEKVRNDFFLGGAGLAKSTDGVGRVG
ncbi:hypothetical protein E2562_037540 [Oryza meyeriana var. granulata]|uniref:Uncharacterized protein n=1 Tax=Oryza meyeriana var. granulata TaxID=110450 RepID=A0A6G1DT07_9ORYZ|nr:hypothetical protein E2562_037540 [Oryza meyeriana var. granulata]